MREGSIGLTFVLEPEGPVVMEAVGDAAEKGVRSGDLICEVDGVEQGDKFE